MQRSIWGNVWLGVFVLAMVLATASAVGAQSVIDAGRAEFTPSPDHNAVDPPTGVPLVQSYSLQIFLVGGITPVQAVSLGKPTPQPDGMIRLDFVSLLSTPLTPGVIYEAHVAAVGPGGSAASVRSNTFAFSLPCAASISPGSQSVAAAGGSGSSTITVGAGCAWTAVSNVAWITISAGATGSGTGSVTYTVAANPGYTPRTGTLTVGGNALTVTQAGLPCAPTISPTSANVQSAGGPGTVLVTPATGCPWTATSNAAWITISAGGSGSGNGSLTYTADANPGTTARTGTLTVAGNTFTVIQAGTTCAPTIAPTSANVVSAGSASVVTVTAATGCAWTATSNASWITLSAGATGSGTGSVTYSVAANAGTTSRTGTLTIAGATLMVTQAGTSCVPTISPASANVLSGGSAGSVTVTPATAEYGNTACAWTATSNATWITISAGATGSGSGLVTYTVDANSATTTRTGTLTIGGNTFSVTQAAASCSYTISPTSASALSAGSAGSVAVTAATGCAWTAASNATWITISAGVTGSGNGSVTYTVAANPSTTPRTGTLTIGGNALTVTQAGTACAPTIAPTSANVVAAGSAGSVTVTAATGCAWTATSDAPWITISAGTSGSGTGTVTYTVAANPGTTSRTGTLTIGGHTFTVTQAGATCAPTVSPASANVVAAGNTGTVTVTAATGCAWTAASNAPWITISAGATGSGSGTVSYTVAANPGTTSRTGTLTVGGNTFTVTQAGTSCDPTISPASSNVVAAGGADSVTVTAATGCAWTATSNAPWITITAGSTGSGNGSVTYSVAANPNITSRTGTLTVGGNTFTVTQAGTSCAPAISPTSASSVSAGMTGVVTVSAPTGCAWTATSNAAWITISAGATGSGTSTVTYTVAANPGATPRTGTLTIGGNTYTVTQAGSSCVPTLSPTNHSLPANGGSGIVSVTIGSACSWTAASDSSWVTITSGASRTGPGTVGYTAAGNTTGAARTATLMIAGQSFLVTEPSASCTFAVSPSLLIPPPGGSTGMITVTTQPTCAWTSSASATWVTVTASGTGSGTGTYAVTANPGTTTRSATISVAGVLISVIQNQPTAPATAPATALPAPGNLRVIIKGG